MNTKLLLSVIYNTWTTCTNG